MDLGASVSRRAPAPTGGSGSGRVGAPVDAVEGETSPTTGISPIHTHGSKAVSSRVHLQQQHLEAWMEMELSCSE